MIDPDTIENSPSMRFAKRLFNIMDENKDGELSIEEFVKGFHKLQVNGSCYGDVTVTAYVNERKLTKEDLLPKPAIQLRRKSLRGGSDLKLFNNEDKRGDDDPEIKLANGKGNDQAALVINAASIASAAKAATIISTKAKMHKEDNGNDRDIVDVKDVQAAVMNAGTIASAAKAATIISAKVKMHKEDSKCTTADSVAAAKAKMHKKEAIRKIRKVWKINLFW